MTNRELLDACVQNGGAIEPWRAFIQRFRGIIANAVGLQAVKFGHKPHEFTQDGSSEIFMKLCENDFQLLRGVKFKPGEDERFFGYIKVVATHFAIDYFRRLNAKMRGGGGEPEPLDDRNIAISSPKRDWSEEIARTLDIEKALAKATRGIHARRNQMIFWLHFQQGFSPEEIAALPTVNLSRKGIETMLSRTIMKVRRTLYQKNQHSTISTKA